MTIISNKNRNSIGLGKVFIEKREKTNDFLRFRKILRLLKCLRVANY
jgi:hypothetical protein